MTTATKKPRKGKTQDAQRDALVGQLSSLTLLGAVLTWNARSNAAHTHATVEKALEDAGLDKKMAPPHSWETAFSRAKGELKKAGWMVHAVKQLPSREVKYQFTVNELDSAGEVMNFVAKTYVTYHEGTGLCTGKNKEVVEKVQALVARFKEEYSTHDVTMVVQRLFDTYAEQNPGGDLMPIRDQGGCYFVTAAHFPFTEKMHLFLVQKLGGRLRRLPVPAGTDFGDKDVQETVKDFLHDKLEKFRAEVAGFGSTTQVRTLEERAATINRYRLEIEAHAGILKDQAGLVLEELEEVDEELVECIERIAAEREAASGMAVAEEDGNGQETEPQPEGDAI